MTSVKNRDLSIGLQKHFLRIVVGHISVFRHGFLISPLANLFVFWIFAIHIDLMLELKKKNK